MEPNQTQPIPNPISPQSGGKKWIIVSVAVILILGAGFYYYQSTKKNTQTMDTQEQVPFNDKAKIILTKDFMYPSETPSTLYALVHQMNGSVSYKIFINTTTVDSGDPKFGSAGSLPLDTSLFKNGTNTLRLEVDPQPEIGGFEKNSSCDIAVIGANEGDIASTRIEENTNVLAQITCPALYTRDPGLLPEPSDSEKSAVIEAYDQFKSLVESKDIELLTQYVTAIDNSLFADALKDKNRDIMLNTLITDFSYAPVNDLKKPTTLWEKSVGDKTIISFKAPLPEHKKEKGVENIQVYFKLINNEWFWVGERIGDYYQGVVSR